MFKCHLGGRSWQIPSHVDHQEFTQKVCASFEVPKVCNWAKKVENYYAQLPVHPSVGKHHFLLPKDMRFGAQDIHLSTLLPMQRPCSIGLRTYIPQSLANLIIWWGVYKNSGSQWSHSSPSKRKRSS